jgi:predicted RNA binding protein YcfA (HicA-like mRNA interferase family)
LDIIKIAIAIHVKEIGSTSGIDKDGFAPHATKGSHRAVDAAR